MRERSLRLLSMPAVLLALIMYAPPAFAQGGAGISTTLGGSVVDTSGGVVPGVDIVARNNATATEYRAVTDDGGRFVVTAINPGTYTVTVTLMGFKTVVLPDVQVITGSPANIKPVTLEVGKLEESVTVRGATEIVQTQNASVTTTLTTQQINSAPLTTRNTLDFVAMLPGVNSTQAARYSTVMGLPGSALNITIDGLNTQDQALKGSTGSAFFTVISPRLDAVEEVSVSTANPGAESSGQGAVQVRFQTRSGTNKFQGSLYDYMRRTRWNTNYWFNQFQNSPALPPDRTQVDTFGGRIGGPIMRDKAFFFFNYEEFRQPLSVSRSRTVLTPDAFNGVFVYNGTATSQQLTAAPWCQNTTSADNKPQVACNLYQMATSFGQTNTYDPALHQIFTDINATLAGRSVQQGSNTWTNSLTFQNTSQSRRIYPTVRGDVNVTANNRVGVSFYIQRYLATPDTLNSRDPAFPGYKMQGNQTSWRPALMGNWRSVINANVVNEVRLGYTGWTPTHFSDNITTDMFPGGRRISVPTISMPYTGNNYELRSSPNLNVEDTLNWVKGKHTFTFGGAFTRVGYSDYYQYYVPFVGIGMDTTRDPAGAMFTATNFPGSASADRTDAGRLYAILTGRITSLNNTAFLNPDTGQYQYMGPWQYSVHQKEIGAFVQDSWKIRPNITLNGGLRWEVQLPFTSANHYFTQLTDYNMLFGVSGVDSNGQPNMFKPGVMTGTSAIKFQELKPGEPPFNTDWNNIAPSVGIAYRMNVASGGWLSKIFSSDPVFRAGYSKAYVREGMSTTSNIFAANPGGSYQAFRNRNNGLLVPNGTALLYRQTDQLTPPSFPDAPAYPLDVKFDNAINAFNPNTATPWVHSFNVSFQRAITKDTAIDIRYVGNRSRGGWVDGGRNINELNVLENGFIDEFKHAQANYLINMQANNWTSAGASFAYKGLPGQSPLPILQAYFSKYSSDPANALYHNPADPGQYTSSYYTSATYLGYLVPTNPNITGLASDLFENMRANGTGAGLPENFFYMNPAITAANGNGVFVTGRPEDALMSNYDALQLELRRRMNNGLLVQGSYQYIIRQQSSENITLRHAPGWSELERGRTEGSARHVLKMNWVYELPFGQGKRFGGGVSRGWNRLIGGWSFDGLLRIQSGPIIDFGNVRLVGFTDADLQKMIKLRFAPDTANPQITRVFLLPQDVIDNTIKAYKTDYSSPTGYSSSGVPTGRYFAPIMSTPGCYQYYTGSCGYPIHHYVTGPKFFRTDMSIAKRIDFTSKVWSELRLEALNVFNSIDFLYNGGNALGGTSTNSYQVTGAFRDPNNTQDPGGRLLQMSWRISF